MSRQEEDRKARIAKMAIMRTGAREDLSDLINVRSKDFVAFANFCHDIAPDKRTDTKGLSKVRNLPFVPVKRSEIADILVVAGVDYTFDDAKKELTMKHGLKMLVIKYD